MPGIEKFPWLCSQKIVFLSQYREKTTEKCAGKLRMSLSYKLKCVSVTVKSIFIRLSWTELKEFGKFSSPNESNEFWDACVLCVVQSTLLKIAGANYQTGAFVSFFSRRNYCKPFRAWRKSTARACRPFFLIFVTLSVIFCYKVNSTSWADTDSRNVPLSMSRTFADKN